MSYLHVLNGDALKENFPKEFIDNAMVFRECLVDGIEYPKDIELFWDARAEFISDNYGGTKESYFDKLLPEITKLKSLKEGSDVFLWFEDDLFCQVNFWFLCRYINSLNIQLNLFLVRPNHNSWTGFGMMDYKELRMAFEKKTFIHERQRSALAESWNYFVDNDHSSLRSNRKVLKDLLPRYEEVINANALGAENIIQSIILNLDEPDFATCFREFHNKAGVFGFGDLQVKRIYDRFVTPKSK